MTGIPVLPNGKIRASFGTTRNLDRKQMRIVPSEIQNVIMGYNYQNVRFSIGDDGHSICF